MQHVWHAGRRCYPGCPAPAWWCEAHHVTYWRHGGRTDIDNLAPGGTPQLQLTNLHGDVVATVDDDINVVATNAAYFESTEYGALRIQNTTNPNRYGWLGAKQRSTDALAGLVLMGVRLYNPTTGRFLSVDPVVDGNDNA